MLTAIAPFMELGQTMKGKDADNNLLHEDKLGMIQTFPVQTLTGGPNRSKSVKTGKVIVAVLLRNTAGFALLPKQLAQLDRTAGYGMTKNADGYSTTNNNRGVVLVDSFLPAAGVADDDLFWGIIGGPAPVLVPIAGAGFNGDIAVNGLLVAATGTTTGVTTSGRISNFTAITADTTLAVQIAAGILGRAMSARTTGETTSGTDLLVDWAIRL